jgi:hypothetical protein
MGCPRTAPPNPELVPNDSVSKVASQSSCLISIISGLAKNLFQGGVRLPDVR